MIDAILEKIMSKLTKTSDAEREQNTKGGTIAVVIFIILVVGVYLGCIGMIAKGLWNKHQYEKVVGAEHAGKIISASYQNPSFGTPTSAITTARGTFLVVGVMQGLSGHRVRIEGRANGDKALCNEETNVCKRIYPEEGDPGEGSVGFFVFMLALMTFALAITFWAHSAGKSEDDQSKEAHDSNELPTT